MRQRKKMLTMICKDWKNFFLSVSLLSLVGCNEIPSEHQEFFRSGPEKIENEIFNYPLDQQIELMIIGWTIPHPNLHLYFQVARNGEKVVPLLIQRLSDLKDLEALRVLAICLYEIDFRYFKWTAHQKYVEMSEEAIGEIGDPSIQQEIKAILETGKLHPYAHELKQGKTIE